MVASPQATGTPLPPLTQKISKRMQEVEKNPYSDPQLQGGPYLQIRCVIEEAANQEVNIPTTDDSCHFFLSFHLKGVCNSNCGGQNSHRGLSQRELDQLVGWHKKFCGY